jgi:hypothetical protein
VNKNMNPTQNPSSSAQPARQFHDALRKAADARARETGVQFPADLSARIATPIDWRERS